jgi:hypothetical protein
MGRELSSTGYCPMLFFVSHHVPPDKIYLVPHLRKRPKKISAKFSATITGLIGFKAA